MVMSVSVTVSLTVERYLSVVRPLWRVRHRAGPACLALPGLVLAVLLTSPNYLALRPVPADPAWQLVQPGRSRLQWAEWRRETGTAAAALLWWDCSQVH